MDVATAAEYLSVSERTLRTRLREGTIPGWKMAGLWRLSKAALDGMLAPVVPRPRDASVRRSPPC